MLHFKNYNVYLIILILFRKKSILKFFTLNINLTTYIYIYDNRKYFINQLGIHRKTGF